MDYCRVRSKLMFSQYKPTNKCLLKTNPCGYDKRRGVGAHAAAVRSCLREAKRRWGSWRRPGACPAVSARSRSPAQGLRPGLSPAHSATTAPLDLDCSELPTNNKGKLGFRQKQNDFNLDSDNNIVVTTASNTRFDNNYCQRQSIHNLAHMWLLST